MAPNRNLSYPEFQAANWKPAKDEMGGTIGARSFEEWKARTNVPADGHEVTISMGPKGVEAAVADGKVKNIFEIPKNKREAYRGEAYMRNRRATETSVLGIPATAGSARRPVYGHVRETGDYNAEGNMYGRVNLDVWPGKNHITTTAGDSLDTLLENHGRGVVDRADAWETTGFDDLHDDHLPSNSWGDYREAQIHGVVPMSGTHIKRAEVRNTGGIHPPDDRFLVQGLRARGIPTTVVKKWEQPSLITTESITQTVPRTGAEFVDYEDTPMTRGEHFLAGIPKEWENR